MSEVRTTRTRNRIWIAARRRAVKMADVLGLHKLHDYFTGPCRLSSDPVWLMGTCFKNKLEQLSTELDKKARLRSSSMVRDITGDNWTSDLGWGCAIRSGQMMIAQACLDHLKSRSVRNCDIHSGKISKVVSLFWDSPLDDHVFSIHHICEIASRSGVEPGTWVGPGFVSRVLSEIINLHHPFNLHVQLISQPAGASYITPEKIDEMRLVFGGEEEEDSTPPESLDQPIDEDDPLGLNSLPPGLVIMIPLLLGTSKMHPRYLWQVKETLKWTQSIGIIGGRSSSSLYLVGFQGDRILYLDPHRPQTVTTAPGEITSYFNAPFKQMSENVVITSLSLGFYCKTKTEFEDLIVQLRQLEESSSGAPIIAFPEGEIPNGAAPSVTWSMVDDFVVDDELSDWEII